jgi:hypothetical protein
MKIFKSVDIEITILHHGMVINWKARSVLPMNEKICCAVIVEITWSWSAETQHINDIS